MSWPLNVLTSSDPDIIWPTGHPKSASKHWVLTTGLCPWEPSVHPKGVSIIYLLIQTSGIWQDHHWVLWVRKFLLLHHVTREEATVHHSLEIKAEGAIPVCSQETEKNECFSVPSLLLWFLMVQDTPWKEPFKKGLLSVNTIKTFFRGIFRG